MPKPHSEHPLAVIKWRETSHGLQVGNAAGFAFQARQTPEGLWQPRMKIWASNARFEDVGQPVNTVEEAMSECEAAHRHAAQSYYASAAEPAPAPAPAPQPARPVASRPARPEPREQPSPRRSMPVHPKPQEKMQEAPQEQAQFTRKPAPQKAAAASATQASTTTKKPEMEPRRVATPALSSGDTILDKVIAERDRAIAAFHAALCRPEAELPEEYKDLFDVDHPEILAAQARLEREAEAYQAQQRQKVAEPVG